MINSIKIHIKKKILIAGGGGFVGKHLFFFLKKKNIFKIYNPSRRSFDLSDLNVYKNILITFQPNIIIHLAARTVPTILTKKEDRLQFRNTTLPVINLVDSLKFCTELEKIIFFGSIEEYGLSKLPFSEKNPTIPVSSYGKAKVSALKYVKSKIKDNKYNYIWIRPSLIFGKKNNKKRFLGSLYYALKYKKRVKVSINSQIRDFLYINDLCRFIELLIVEHIKIKENILNVTAENWINLNTIFFYFQKKIQKKFQKLLLIDYNKKHLDYYSSGELLKEKFKEFKFSKFKKSLNFSFGLRY
jgi:nucleoside-diphosphate-sugar epimerase